MLNRFPATAACVLLLLFHTLAHSPAEALAAVAESSRSIHSFTTIERFAAYAILGVLFSFAYPRNLVAVSALVLVTPIVLELLQVFTPDREARVVDVVEKLAGGAAGILVANAVLLLRKH